MTAKTDPKRSRTLPADLSAVSLIDAATCAAAGDMSLSWWHDEVRAGRAPAPVIRQSRCSRWRLSDVRSYWSKRAENGLADITASGVVTLRAKKASDAAKAKRVARSSGVMR